MKKLIIIGIDGADPVYIERAVKAGKMPTFSKLIKSGSFGMLKSTIPPLSLPAWPSIYTGKNPGKTGIYNFSQLQEGSYQTEIVDWKVKRAVWQILSENRKRVAVINNYFTYPPDNVKGIMVSGIDNIKEGCYYPKEFEKEITEKLGKLDFGWIGQEYYATPKKDLTRLTDIMLRNNVELVRYIIKNKDFDFLMTTLDIDRIHHLVAEEKELFDWYAKIDSLVNEIIREVKDADIILLSDHGGGRIKKEFYVNEFLKERGFLRLKQKYKDKPSRFFVKIGLSMENTLKFLQFTRIDRLLLKILPHKVCESFLNYARTKIPRKDVPFSNAEIDWLNTKAFSPYPSTGAIQINLAGREPYGIVKKGDYEKTVNEVINELKKLECGGEKIKVDLYRKEQIYSGPFLDKAPDISLIIDDWQYFPKISFSGSLFKNPRDPGHHRCYGFFLASGKDFKKTKIKDASVYDVAPTVLKFFGIPVPHDCDGRVLKIIK